MNQFTLVYDIIGSIHSNLELPLYQEHFQITPYDSTVRYDPRSTLYYSKAGKQTAVHDIFVQQGFRVVYDNLEEPGHNVKSRLNFEGNHGYILHNQNYFWYHDSLLMIDQNYHTYQPHKNYKKLALMPMGRAGAHRTMLLEKVVAYLDDFYWSYQELGRRLPNDVLTNHSSHQRYLNPDWYNDTCFSLVAESKVSRTSDEMLQITEKTFKPIAFRHPFLVWGEMGILQLLKKLGFETFDNLFDESYDTIVDNKQRLDALVKNISKISKEPYDTITVEKLQHNHARFFDRALVEKRIREEIIHPLLAYAEATQ